MKEYNGNFVTLMLCSQCNNACKHCYVKYNWRFLDEELQRLIPILKKNYKRVILNGTEPILFPEYFKYFKEVGEHRIMTNGIEILKNRKVLYDLINNNIDTVRLSYHFGIQDELSMIKTDDLIKVIKLLKDYNFKIKLMCSLSCDNYKNVSDYCDKAVNFGVQKIKFTNFINQWSAHNNYESKKFLDQNKINYVLNQIEIIRKKTPKEKLEIERCGSFGPCFYKNNFECLAGNNMVVITPDKKVYSCVFDISEDWCIGYMTDDYKIMIDEKKINLDTSYCKILKKYNGIGW